MCVRVCPMITLFRIKLDANRNIGEATFGVKETEDAWRQYQDYINQSKSTIGGGGLFIDVHGQAHVEDWIELGYLFSGRMFGYHFVMKITVKQYGNRVHLVFEFIIQYKR